MQYRVNTCVVRVEEKKRVLRTYKKVGANNQEEIIADTETLGWFVSFEGSWESLYLGREKPALTVGQQVAILIQPVETPVVQLPIT
jgi:hypothetical protein